MDHDSNYIEHELRRELAHFSKWLYRLGYMPGTSGNLSVQLDSNFVLATPTGVSKWLLRADDMTIVDRNGKKFSGRRNATSEVGMHLAIYNNRPDVRAVIHSHPPIATAFACSGRALTEVLCQESVMTLGSVPLADYATTGTGKVAASLLPLLQDHEAILLANHGAISYGRSLLDAFMKMETLEHLAQVHLAAHQLATPQPLKQEQIAELRSAKAKYLQNAI